MSNKQELMDWNNNNEEIFFLQYHLGWSSIKARNLSSESRRWVIRKYCELKRKEKDQ